MELENYSEAPIPTDKQATKTAKAMRVIGQAEEEPAKAMAMDGAKAEQMTPYKTKHYKTSSNTI